MDAVWMDRDDALAYIVRYPVVMFEETSGLPVNGNFSEIYNNAITIGLTNKRNIKKGTDVKYDDLYQWQIANFGFQGTGENEGYVSVKQEGKQLKGVPNGPQSFYELAKFWYQLQKKFVDKLQYPPLFLRIKLNVSDTSHIKYVGTLKKVDYSKNVSGVDADIHVFRVVFALSNYCCVGDILSLSDSIDSATVLFAHKDICAKKELAAPNKNLYTPLGIFFNASDNVVVLRTALFTNRTNQTMSYFSATYAEYVAGYRKNDTWVDAKFNYQDETYVKGSFNVDNVILKNNSVNVYYTLLTNPKTVFDGIISAFMNSEGDSENLTWKGLNDLNYSELGIRYSFFSGLCSQSPVIPGYPYICACLGNGDEEAMFQKQDPNFSFFCNSAKCQNSNGLNVFKFTPTIKPLCPDVYLCNQNIEGNVFTFVKVKSDMSKCQLTANSSVMGILQQPTCVGIYVSVIAVIVLLLVILFYASNKNTV